MEGGETSVPDHETNNDISVSGYAEIEKILNVNLDENKKKPNGDLCGCFDRVIVWAHGTPGNIDSGAKGEAISSMSLFFQLKGIKSNNPELEAELQALKGIGKTVCKDGVIELRGCNIGKDELFEKYAEEFIGKDVKVWTGEIAPTPLGGPTYFHKFWQ